MTLDRSLSTLVRHVQQLHDSLTALRVTLVEDRPQAGDVALVDLYCDAVDDMLGWLQEGATALHRGRQAIGNGQEGKSWQELSVFQAHFNRVEHRYVDLISHARLAPLLQFVHQRGGEWLAWAGSVQIGLDDCHQQIFGVKQRLLACWQEATDIARWPAVSVRNVAIGG